MMQAHADAVAGAGEPCRRSRRRSAAAGAALRAADAGRRRGAERGAGAGAARRSGGAVSNLYGPTETTIWSAAMTLEVRARWRAMRGDASRGAADWSSDLEHAGLCFGRRSWSLLPAGLRGSFTLRGLGVARGYLGRFGLTAERFVADPYGAGGEPDVPHRGPGAVACGRGAGVSGPGGRAGEAARVPDRAWRDRGGAVLAQAGVSQAAVVAREDRAGPARGWWATWLRRRGRALDGCGASGCAVAAAAGLHGAVCDRGAGSAAADAERQAGPPRAACAGADAVGRAACCRARRRRRSCARCLPRCWASSGSGSTTTSSSWAVIRCWRRG